MEPVRASGLLFAMADASQIIARRKKQGIVKLDGRMTSVSLEPKFWAALKDMAREQGTSAADIVRQIDKNRSHDNLTSAVRLFILGHYRSLCAISA
jgi:predicted DNA-binding ribbon-helix-helix protein